MVLVEVNRFQFHFQPNSSPDSQFLAFTQVTPVTGKGGVSSTETYDILRISAPGGTATTYTFDILRIPASGGTATNLTSDTTAECWSIGWR